MKKILVSTFLILFAIGVISYTYISTKVKVLKINSPFEIFVDENNNLIFDEKSPIKLTNIYYFNANTDLKIFPIFKTLSKEQKFILEYLALDKCKKLIENKHIKLKKGKIYIDREEYSNLLLESNLYFTEEIKTQEKVINYIKSFPIDDYVLFNPQTKYYHSLSCEQAQETKNIILMKKTKLRSNWQPCKACYNQEPITSVETAKQIEKGINKSFETIFLNLATSVKALVVLH